MWEKRPGEQARPASFLVVDSKKLKARLLVFAK